jgi:copper chaperone NosL
MKKLIAIIPIVILGACSTEPQPLQFGKDACHSCKMTLMDKRFGAEIVTTKGKVYKFDDVNCMVNFLNAGELTDRDVKHSLVVDFANPEKLIETRHAFFLRSENIKSPMASHVAAFETEVDFKANKNELKGIYLVWGELITQFK